VRKTHAANRESPIYRRLVRARHQIHNFQTSIRIYRDKIEALQKRIYNVTRRKEELELKFGQERAARKRSKAA
jgi:chromosome segregation ATPase